MYIPFGGSMCPDEYTKTIYLNSIFSRLTNSKYNIMFYCFDMQQLINLRHDIIRRLTNFACQYEEEGYNIIIKSTHSTIFFEVPEQKVQGQQFQYIEVDEHNELLEDINFLNACKKYRRKQKNKVVLYIKKQGRWRND